MSQASVVSAEKSVAKAEKPTAVRWKIFFLMLFLISINYIDRASLSVAMPLISEEFGLTPTQQGMLLSCFFWTYAFMQIPGGMLADKYKPRIVIAASTVMWGLFQTLAALCHNWFLLLATRLGLGASEAPIYPAGGKLQAIWLTRTERGRGATLLDGGAPLGAALGAILITWLISFFGSWRTAFIVAGVGTMIAGYFAWRYIRNNPKDHPTINPAELTHIEEAMAREDVEDSVPGSGNVMDFFKYRSVWLMFGGWMTFNCVFYGLLTWMPTYLHKEYGFNIMKMGGASFIIFFSGFIGELVGGWLADKWRANGGNPNKVMRTLLGLAGVLVTISIYSVAYTSNPTAVVFLLSCTLFFLRWVGLFWSLPSILANRDKIGFLGGCMNLAGNISGILVPIIVGLIVQHTGSYFLALNFFACAGVCLFLCCINIDYTRKLPV